MSALRRNRNGGTVRMIGTLVAIIAAAPVAFFGLQASPAHAWGHLPDLRSREGQAHIVFAAIERARIGYCAQVNDAPFAPEDIAVQVEGALNVWLAEIADLLPTPVVIERDCDVQTLDVLVIIEPAVPRSTLFGEHLLVTEGERTISRITVNTDPISGVPVERVNVFELADGDATAGEKADYLGTRARRWPKPARACWNTRFGVHPAATQLALSDDCP